MVNSKGAERNCMNCAHGEERYERIENEDWLLRFCELSGAHVDDDFCCDKWERV